MQNRQNSRNRAQPSILLLFGPWEGTGVQQIQSQIEKRNFHAVHANTAESFGVVSKNFYIPHKITTVNLQNKKSNKRIFTRTKMTRSTTQRIQDLVTEVQVNYRRAGGERVNTQHK